MWKVFASAAITWGLAYVAYRRRVHAVERRSLGLEQELAAKIESLESSEQRLAATSDELVTRQLLEVERLRLRIAADLHDDVGSSLTQIAIQSEVARRELGDTERAAARLDKIAEDARELAAAVSDVVWSIDPERDRSQDLATRMRRFASDVLAARSIRFRFDATSANQNVHLDGELRRQVYLIFKEAINNITRHAWCTTVEITLEVADGRLRLRVVDDGRGFDPSEASSGHGLASMRRRAALLGGELEVVSSPGTGTAVELSTPLRGEDVLKRPEASHCLPT